ncbi:alpha/beta fold hydrolase [Arcanobacterium haemolyticum]|nr:alpha/beta fold hydrolase [Arcanobacterium haemolyticum]
MHTTTQRITGHTTYDHTFTAPLDYFGALAGLSPEEKAQLPETIDVFAREYVRDGQEKAPRLVYFQGGPGSAGPRMAPIGSWLDTALNYFRVVLLDERGTGRSHPLEQIAVTSVGGAKAQAAYLACFRQDSIVRDAEALRHELQDDEKWAVLGQSFGGFCVTTYLSQHPEGLSEAFVTAGLPSTHLHADEVYRRTFASTAGRNREFFDRYPGDEAVAWDIARHLADTEELMPNGERLTPARFRQLGLSLGWSYGLEALHFALEDPMWQMGGRRRLRPQFLARMCEHLSFASTPLYGVIHEAIYGQASTGATAWSAHRVRDEFPEFTLPNLSAGGAGEDELRKAGMGFRFSGEHVFPWQIASDPALAPMAEAADFVAAKDDWPELYSREALAENTVPAAAWIYVDDMFVPYELSVTTAKEIRGLHPLITNDFHHDGLRTGGPMIIDRLVKAVRE